MSFDQSATPADGEAITLSQRGDLRSFLGLSLKNGLLNIVTLTLYRFWGKTEVRRRVWSTTYLNDEAFEYTGRGIELFLGFLIALAAVGLPFLLTLFAAQFLPPLLAALLVLAAYLFVTVLFGFGMFTAFRYLASRTSWRGVRFLLRGSAVNYGVSYLAYAWLSGITLGWFWPAAQRRLAAPLWGGLRFGDRRFTFSLDQARKEKIYGPFAIGWAGMAIGYFPLVGVMTNIAGETLRNADGSPPELSLSQLGLIYAVFGVAVLAYAVLFAPYHAAILRSIASGLSFDGVRFKLRIKAVDMAWIALSNIVLLTVSLGFLMPLVQARTTKFLVGRLEASGSTNLATIHQAADAGPKTGEGLADAFGISSI